jgi:ADP-heptose:LPS heptosyltransferase
MIMMTKPKKILLLLSERIGDVIFCTPAIALLKAQYPQATIGAITTSKVVEQVLTNNPAITHVYVNPNDAQIKSFAKEYSMVIDLHNNKITAAWRNMLPIEETYINPRKGEIHQSEVATQFMARILNQPLENASKQYHLFPQQNNKAAVQQMLREHNVDPARHILIGCHMGSHTTTRRGWKFWKPLTGEKCWPIAAFGEVMQAMQKQNPNIRFVLTGTPAESELSKKLTKYFPDAIDLIGKTSVLDLAELMKLFRVFLTGDTGPMHVATAMNTPLIGLFGPTNPDHTGPYPLARHHVILKANNLPEIPVHKVVTACSGFLP